MIMCQGWHSKNRIVFLEKYVIIDSMCYMFTNGKIDDQVCVLKLTGI